MEHMMLIVLVIISVAAMALSLAAGFAAYVAWLCLKQKWNLVPFNVKPSDERNPVPISLDISEKNAESEADDSIPFNAEEALAEMNEWERSLCAKQQAAWEQLNQGQTWKLTPGIYRQIRRAALRKI